MKKTLLLLSIFLLQYSYAQQSGTVTLTGTVVDKETGDPLEYATLVLRSLDNPDMVTGGMTDFDGKFNVKVSAGNYDISVEFISYKSYTLHNQSLTGSRDLGTIPLALDVSQLDEVEVVGQRTTVELRLDKKIYNVGQDLTTRGGSVSDVLDNVPSVSVDVEGNVSLRGNDDVRILINGRPSSMVGQNSADILRQLPADAIEKVEVITSPSARYDAQGTGGILNIILKKGKIQGFNGSVVVNTGIPDNHGISGNLNYKTGKFNFFTTTGFNYRDSPGNSYDRTEYLSDSVPNRFLNETRKRNRKSNAFNTNFGIEYDINDKNSLVASVFYRNNNGDNTTDNYTDKFDRDRVLTDQVYRFTAEDEFDNTLEYNLNYISKFNDDGHELTVILQHSKNKDDERSLITERSTYPSEGAPVEEKLSTLENQKNILLQADYVLPIKENTQFEAGYRGTLLDMSNDYKVENQDEDGNFYINEDLTNLFNYTEDVHAFYAQYGTKFNKLSVLLGLRTEITNITVAVEGHDLDARKDYTKLFPTVNLGYELSENETFTLGYNRRIRRPWSRFLNPFPSRESKTNFFEGNPDLDPSYSDVFDLGFLRQWQNFTLNASVYYQYSTDVFQFISEPTGELTNEDDPIIRRTPVNLATDSRFGVEFALMYSPFRWWRINSDFNLFRSELRGSYNEVDFDADNTQWFTRLNSKLTLPAKIDFQTILFYRGPFENAQNKYKGILSTNLAFSKDIMNDNGTIAFNVNDLFNSRKRQIETTTDAFLRDSEFQWRERQFTLSFTYRFNQAKRERERGQRQGQDDDGDGFTG